MMTKSSSSLEDTAIAITNAPVFFRLFFFMMKAMTLYLISPLSQFLQRDRVSASFRTAIF